MKYWYFLVEISETHIFSCKINFFSSQSCSWLLLAALGSFGQLLAALGSSGQLWAASGSSGQLLAALGSSWQLWTAPGSSGQLLATLGSSSMEEMLEIRTTSSSPLLYVVALSLCMLLTSLAFFVTFFAAVHSFFLASQYLILFLLFVHSFS